MFDTDKSGEQGKIGFLDTVTGAYCRLLENRLENGTIEYTCRWKPANEKTCYKMNFSGDMYDSAWTCYRAKLNFVLDTIQFWDND